MSSSSSSSSINSSSSSSSSSINSSSSSSSVDSSSSSSSSSVDSSSSSSSSSFLDYSNEKLIPFAIEFDNKGKTWDITHYGNESFLGTGPDGIVLRSKNKYHWGLYYKINDIHATTVYARGSSLFVGSSPNGKIYRFNLKDDEKFYYGSFDGHVVNFVEFGSNLYAAFKNGRIYVLNSFSDKWELKYKAFAQIEEMTVLKDKVYLAVKGENIITFDGDTWDLLDIGQSNISSLRRTGAKEITSPLSIQNKDASTPNGHELIEMYPVNRSIGLSCIEGDGSSIVMGSVNKARVYSFIEQETDLTKRFRLMFDTDLTRVYDLLNVDVGVNLAAIDNKLFLLFSGKLPFETEEADNPTQNDNIDAKQEQPKKSVSLTFPNGDEQIELGEDITIQWSSPLNQNDAIKLALYKDGSEALVISPQTTNDGRFEWTVPLSLEPSSGYRVYIEWLSAGEASEENKDLSDADFSIVFNATTTTTTTTPSPPPDPQVPDRSICRGIPILVLKDENIIKIKRDNSLNSILLLTSTGRILEFNRSIINGYLTGNRTIWANVQDGKGNDKGVDLEVLYALHQRVVEVNAEKEITKWEYAESASAISDGKIKGVFVSPLLYVKEDIGNWQSLLWNETKHDKTEIWVSVKSGASVESMREKEWSLTFKSGPDESGTILRDLKPFDLKGQYAQIKIEMLTNSNSSPSVANISLVYSNKKSSYFFTKMFSLEESSNVKNGLIIAEMSETTNTEVQIGISGEETSEWNDYQVVPLEKFFEIPNLKNIKVGVKLTSYDETHTPSIGEFALILGGEKQQRIME